MNGWRALNLTVLLLLPSSMAWTQITPAPAFGADLRQWRSLADVLRAADPVFEDQAVRKAASEAVPPGPIREALNWSGEEGFLLQVRLQAPAGAPGSAAPLGQPLQLGVGASPLDAAMVAYHRAPLRAAPLPGRKELIGRGFFVWVTKPNRRDDLRFQHLDADESGRLRRAVTTSLAQSERASKIRAAWTSRIMQGVRTAAQRTFTLAQLAALDAGIARYRDASKALTDAESNLPDWLEWKLGADKALQALEGYRNILTLKGMQVQTSAALRAKARNDVRRARSYDEIRAILFTESDDLKWQIAKVHLAPLRQQEAERYAAVLTAMPTTKPAAEVVARLLPARR